MNYLMQYTIGPSNTSLKIYVIQHFLVIKVHITFVLYVCAKAKTRFGSTCSPSKKPSAKCSFTIALQKKPSGQMPSGQMLSILCPKALCQMLSIQMPSKQRAIGGGQLSGGQLVEGICPESICPEGNWQRAFVQRANGGGHMVEGICPEGKWRRAIGGGHLSGG